MKHLSNYNVLKIKSALPLILLSVFFCQLSAQQIVLPNLIQNPNAHVTRDAVTKKYGLQTLDKKTQLLPNEYDQMTDEGYAYSRFIRITKNGYTGIYDCLKSKIIIEPSYSTIEIKELSVPRSTYKYFREKNYYFLTIKDLGRGKKIMGLHDGNTEVLPCDYENIRLINYNNTDSVLIFAARKSQGSIQLFDYTHRRFLTQTFSYIEPETSSKGQTRYKVTVNGKMGIVDANLNWVIDANYLEIMVYDQYSHFKYPENEEFIYVLRITDSTCTFTNYNKPKIINAQPQYSQVRNYDKYINVYKGKKLGLVTLEHKQILPCEYEDLAPFEHSPNLWIAYANKHYGIVNLNNEKICPFAYTSIQEIKAPYALVYKDETFTIFNTKTRKTDSRVFKPSGYTDYDHSEYILSAMLNNKVVLLDSNLVIKKTLIDPPMEEQFAVPSDSDRSGRDQEGPSGDFLVPPYQSGNVAGEGHIKNSKTQNRYTVINANNLQGLMDNELGKEVMKPLYKKIITKETVSKNGIINFVGYQKDKEFGVVNLKTGSTIFSDEMNALYIKRHDNSTLGLIYFELEYKINTTLKRAIADTSGILTEPLYDQVSTFLNGSNWLALVYTENKIRYTDVYDLNNKKYIIKKVQQIHDLSINSKLKYFDVTKDDLHGIINQYGQTLLPLKYKNISFDQINRFTRSSDRFGIITTAKNKYAAIIIDKRGKLNLTDVYDTIHPGVYDYVIAKNKNRYGIVNVRTGKTALAINKQSIKIVTPNINKRNYFIYAINKGTHSVYDSTFKLLTESTDSIVYTGNNTFSHRQKTGFKLYNATTKKFGSYSYNTLSFINEKELFAIRNDSVLTLNSDEKILKVWDTTYSSHVLTSDNYQSKEVLITDFIQCLASPSNKALMTWSQKVAQDLTLYNYFESKKVNDKIIQKTGCVFKSPDTQKNAEALFSVYNKLYDALHEAYGKEFSIEYLSSRSIDNKSITYLGNRVTDTEVAYNKPVIFFKIRIQYTSSKWDISLMNLIN